MFPSILNTFNRPSPTDRLNAPSHSALHNKVSSALGQVEAVIGVEGANSVVGTIMSDIHSPTSDGGGHVQTANKGGTGQTTYTKGDILVASSSSVLTKLAVGSNSGDVLQIDPGQATGIKWGNATANKVAINTSSILVTTVNSTTPLYAASIIGSTLGTNNAIKVTAAYKSAFMGNAWGVGLIYGNNTVASIIAAANTSSTAGIIEAAILGDGATNAQVGWIRMIGTQTGVATTLSRFDLGKSSVESSATQNLIIAAVVGPSGEPSILTGPAIFEKIV